MRVVIDTDPGQDDAVAILLALASPEIDLVAITAVAGNVPVGQTAANAGRVLDLVGHDVPVHAGAAGPMVYTLETAEFVCGPGGLAGVDLPPPSRPPAPEHAALALIRLAQAGPLTVLALGPLTNLALALRLAPGLKLERVLWMGGAMALGNMTPAAEFNAYVDPHAVAVVLDAGFELTMFGLHVTHDATPAPADLARLAAGGSACRAVHGWMTRPRAGGLGSIAHPWHDPCVVAGLLWPDLFQRRACHVSVATDDGPLRGRTTIDWHGRMKQAPNAEVAGAVDAKRLFDHVIERLERLP